MFSWISVFEIISDLEKQLDAAFSIKEAQEEEKKLIEEKNRKILILTDGEKLLYRFIALGLVPIIFAAAGITRSVIRRRRRAAYLKKYSR